MTEHPGVEDARASIDAFDRGDMAALHLVVLLRIQGEREGASLDVNVPNAFRMGPDGSWRESWWLAERPGGRRSLLLVAA